MIRVLYCGDRNWTDRQMVRRVMLALKLKYPGHTVIHGGARGADTQVHLVAHGLGLIREVHPADWRRFGKGSGSVRNQQMLDSGVDLVVAFKDHFNYKMDKGGTEDMIRRALQARVPCVLYAHGREEDTFEAHPHEAQAATAGVQRRDESSDPPTLF